MKKIFLVLFLIPFLVSAQQYVRTARGSQIWLVNANGLDSSLLPSYDFTGAMYKSHVLTAISDSSKFQTTLGIGTRATSSPLTVANVNTSFVAPQSGTMLHIISDNVVNGRISSDTYNNVSLVGPNYQGRRARGSASAPTSVIADDILVTIGGDGYGLTGFHNISLASITMRSEGIMTDISAPTYMTFATTPIGTVTNTERIRIKSTGVVQIFGLNSSGVVQTDVSGNLSTGSLAYNSLTGLPTLFDGNYNSLTNKPLLFTQVSADALYSPIAHLHTGVYQPVGSYLTAETDATVKVINGIIKSNGSVISAAIANTDYALPNAVNTNYASDYRAANFVAGTNYLAPNGSAAALTLFPTFNQNTTGTASTITGSIAQSQVTNLVTDLAGKQAALGFTPYNSTNPSNYISAVPAQSFASLTGKPTTIAGYGITDAAIPTTFLNLASNFSSTILTEVAVTGWSFPVIIGKTYRIEVIASYQTAATTTGGELGFFLTASGAGTIRGKAEGAIVSIAGATELTQGITAIGAADLAGSNLITTGVTAINSPHYFTSLVTFTCTTSGTFNVGWASEVAASSAQLNANSTLIYKALN